jgi:hypothetical protein
MFTHTPTKLLSCLHVLLCRTLIIRGVIYLSDQTLGNNHNHNPHQDLKMLQSNQEDLQDSQEDSQEDLCLKMTPPRQRPEADPSPSLLYMPWQLEEETLSSTTLQSSMIVH